MYHGLRNILILSCAFLRSSYPDEPGYVTDTKTRQKRWNRIDADVDEIARLVDILFAFLRIALREQRHGYRVMKGLGGSEGTCVTAFPNLGLPVFAYSYQKGLLPLPIVQSNYSYTWPYKTDTFFYLSQPRRGAFRF
jgi:hypothetical protein